MDQWNTCGWQFVGFSFNLALWNISMCLWVSPDSRLASASISRWAHEGWCATPRPSASAETGNDASAAADLEELALQDVGHRLGRRPHRALAARYCRFSRDSCTSRRSCTAGTCPQTLLTVDELDL